MKTSTLLVAGLLSGVMALAGCATSPSGQGSASSAPSKGDRTFVNAGTKTDFQAVVAAIHQQMQQGGRFEFTSRSQRQAIDARFADMQPLFDQYGSTGKMSDAQRTQLFNDQEFINGVLTHTDSRRLVCYQDIPVGSHLPIKTCRTYGEINQDRERAQKDLRQPNMRLKSSEHNSLPTGPPPGSKH